MRRRPPYLDIAPSEPRFNEAAGAYPADARLADRVVDRLDPASMRPRGRTPRMLTRAAGEAGNDL